MANVVTPKFRVSYPKLFKPELNKLNQKLEYGCVAVFDLGADLSALEKAVQEAIVGKWGPDKAKWPKALRLPIRDQGDKATEKDGKRLMPDGYVEGAKFLTLKTTQKPGVVDEDVQPVLDESIFYAGCYARASISVYAYDQAGNRGVGVGLTNIQKVADGKPFSGKPTPEASFTPVAKAQDASIF